MLFEDFSKAFDSIHKGNIKLIHLACSLSKETVTAIMMLYWNEKVLVHLPDRDRLLRHCCWSSTTGYISTVSIYNLLRLHSSNVDRSNKRKWLYSKRKSKKQTIESITDADYADDIALLAKAPAQAESLLHSSEPAARGIRFHVNANKTDYICLNREEAMSSLNGGPLKLADKFTYLGSSISSTESV